MTLLACVGLCKIPPARLSARVSSCEWAERADPGKGFTAGVRRINFAPLLCNAKGFGTKTRLRLSPPGIAGGQRRRGDGTGASCGLSVLFQPSRRAPAGLTSDVGIATGGQRRRDGGAGVAHGLVAGRADAAAAGGHDGRRPCGESHRETWRAHDPVPAAGAGCLGCGPIILLCSALLSHLRPRSPQNTSQDVCCRVAPGSEVSWSSAVLDAAAACCIASEMSVGRQPAAARRRAAWRAVRDATEFTCVELQRVLDSKAAPALLQVEQMASEAWSPLWQVGIKP